MQPVKEEGMARLRRVATGRVVPLNTSVFVVFSVVLFNLGPVPAVVEAAGSTPLDNRLAWTRGDARRFLSALGDEGTGLYGVAGARGRLRGYFRHRRSLTPGLDLGLDAILHQPPAVGRATPDPDRRAGPGRERGDSGTPVYLSVGAADARGDAWLATAAKLVLVSLSTVLVVLGLAGVIARPCSGGTPQGNWLLLAIPRRLLAYEPVRISGPFPVSTKVSSAFAARSEGFQAKDWPSSNSCRVSGVATISREA